MAYCSWGKPRLFAKDIEDSAAVWFELPTPVEDSTELSTEQGDKLEATIEGGDNEDVKYKKSNYTLALNIRRLKGRTSPFPDVDGLVNHKYSIALQPEDPEAYGFIIDKCTVTVDDAYTANDGASWNITCDVLLPDSGKKVKWGVVTVTGSGDTLSVSGSGDDFTTE